MGLILSHCKMKIKQNFFQDFGILLRTNSQLSFLAPPVFPMIRRSPLPYDLTDGHSLL